MSHSVYPSAGRAIDFKIVSHRDEFEALEGEWTALFERSGRGRQLFQSHNWLWHWANHFLEAEEAAGNRLAICTGRLDGKLVLVWPTVLEISGPIKRLVWMGAPVGAYGDVLLDQVPEAQGILIDSLDFIRSNSGADLLHLRNVAGDAAAAGVLLAAGMHKVREEEARYIDIKALRSSRDIPALHSRRSKAMLVRKRQRFVNAGGSDVMRVSRGARAEELLGLALAQKRLVAGGSVLSQSSAPDGAVASFLADLARGDHKPVGCEVTSLDADGAPQAIAVGFQVKDTYLSYLVSYEAGCRKYSVGSLLMEDLVRSVCLERGHDIDHMVPETIFKSRWSNWAMPVYELEKPISVLGQLYLRLRGGLIHSVAKRTLRSPTVSAYHSSLRGRA